MSKTRGRRVRENLVRKSRRERITELTQADLDELWRKTDDHDEKHEIFKIASNLLRPQIVDQAGTKDWSEVTLSQIESFPRDGLSECELDVLHELEIRKRRVKRRENVGTDSELSCLRIARPEADRTPTPTSEVATIFGGSDAAASKGLYRRLKTLGQHGELAANLLRAQKSSSRAKKYKGDYKDRSYDRKSEALDTLCSLLGSLSYAWGWSEDKEQPYVPHVLYIDLPVGQVSFHATDRGEGPNYLGTWDGKNASETRIIAFAEQILEENK